MSEAGEYFENAAEGFVEPLSPQEEKSTHSDTGADNQGKEEKIEIHYTFEYNQGEAKIPLGKPCLSKEFSDKVIPSTCDTNEPKSSSNNGDQQEQERQKSRNQYIEEIKPSSQIDKLNNELEEIKKKLEEIQKELKGFGFNLERARNDWKVEFKDQLKKEVKGELMEELKEKMKELEERLKVGLKADCESMIKENTIPLQEALEKVKKLLEVERLEEVERKLAYFDGQHSSYFEFCSSLYLLLLSFFENIILLSSGNEGTLPHNSAILKTIAELSPPLLGLIPEFGSFLSAGMEVALQVYDKFRKHLDVKRANEIKIIIQQHSKLFDSRYARVLAFDIAYEITQKLGDKLAKLINCRELQKSKPLEKAIRLINGNYYLSSQVEIAQTAYDYLWDNLYRITSAEFHAATAEEFKDYCVCIVLLKLVPDLYN